MNSTIFLSANALMEPRSRPDNLVLDRTSVEQLRRIVKVVGAHILLIDWYSVALDYSWSTNTQKLDLLAQQHVYVTNFLPRERRTYVGSHVAIRRYIHHHKIKRWVWIEDVPRPMGVGMKDGNSRFPYPLPPTKHLRPTWDLDVPPAEWGLTVALANKAIEILTTPCPIATRANKQIARLCAEYDAIEKEATDRHPWQGPPGECCLNCIYTDYDRSLQVQRVRQVIKLLNAHDECHNDELLELMKKRLQDLE